MSRYRITSYPTFLTQYNVYRLQRRQLLWWRTIADFRTLPAAIEIKTMLEAL